MKKLLWLLIAVFSLPAMAQEQEKSALEKLSVSGLSFRNIGPALTSGRIADFAVNPTNFSEYYIAAASGGVWKTSDHGITFKPIFDSKGSYSIGCISIAPSNHNIVWVGTGENNNQRSVAYGDGVYRSLDGGKSWKHMGFKESEHIGMISIHPQNAQIVYVAAYGPLWSSGGERGIYRTTDGGANWDLILEVSEHTGFNEIHMDPRDPKVLYATAHQRRRHVWTYVSGGPESAIYKSTDGGDTWNELKNGIPSGDKGRIGLAISPVNPDRIYAMIEGHGVYRSDDRGASFSFLNKYNTSGNYYVELVPDPKDADKVYSLDTYLHVTTDGGKSWQRVPGQGRHVDDHCLWINPQDTRHMIVGCDGGIYETYDEAGSWQHKVNLPVTQFYRVSVDNDEPFYNVYGGTQDNFSLGGPSQTINNRGIVNSDWYVTNTGDGFESQVDPENPNIVYAQAQYGWLVRFDKQSGEKLGIKPFPGKDEPAYRWNWDAPLLISPHDAKTLYFAANKLLESNDRGESWREISDDLTQQIDRHTLPVMGKIQSVDAISYDRSTSNYGNIVALDESPLKKGLIYVGTDDGLIQRTENGGEEWTKLSEFPGIPTNTYVNQVLTSRYDENTVFAVFNNHKNGDFKPYILKSTNKGKSWTSISGNLPERGSVYSIQQDHVKKDLLFAGTEFGAFFTIDGGENWKKLSAGLPTIAIRDIDIQRRENDLVLASFGRGFYILDNYTPLRELSDEVLASDGHFFTTEDALIYLEAQPLGYNRSGFSGSAYYMADNPPVGAVFRYYIKEAPTSLKAKRKKKEKEIRKEDGEVEYPSLEALHAEDREESTYLLFVIKDAEGNEIRRFTKSVGTGIQQAVWNGRYSARAGINTQGEPMTNAGTANLAPAGTYSAEIYLSENGQIKPLGLSSSFDLQWLNNNTLVTQQPAELLAFQQEAEAWRMKLSALQNYRRDTEKKLGQLKAVARNTPGTDLNLLDSLRSLEIKLVDLNVKLNGDKSLSSRNIDTPPSLSSRMNTVGWTSYSSTSAPTGSQKKNLEIVKEEYTPLRASYLAVGQKIDAIASKLSEQGALVPEADLPE